LLRHSVPPFLFISPQANMLPASKNLCGPGLLMKLNLSLCLIN
jgi:hypothetical protein